MPIIPHESRDACSGNPSREVNEKENWYQNGEKQTEEGFHRCIKKYLEAVGSVLVESSEKEVSSSELGPPSCSTNTQKPLENETSSTSLLRLSLLGYSIFADQEVEYKLLDDNLSEIEEKEYKQGVLLLFQIIQ